jgi:NADH-quinone oxidoreductase subunit M
MSQTLANWHILSWVTFLPLMGAVLLLFVNKEKQKVFMYGATAIAALDFLISLPLWFAYQPDFTGGPYDGFQFVEYHDWIPAINVHFIFGIDGISLLLILLTTLLGLIAVVSSYSAIKDRAKEYYIFLLLLQTGMLGVFCSLDFFLFYVFWEVMLVPMYFLIGLWGGKRRLYAAIKFFLYTLLGSVLMLLGILTVYFYVEPNTFDVMQLHRALSTAASDPAWIETSKWVFLAFFVGFAIKVPMFPFHTWLPDAHTEAPTAASVILAAVLLKMGTYGFLRFSLPMMPDATRAFLPWLLGLSIVGVIYGALVAMVQPDWKKLVAYSSVSHLGFTMVGVFALNFDGLRGGVLQMINHGISTGALFLLVGIMYERRHTRMIADYGGLSKQVPVFATVFLIITMSSIGLPMLNGFVGEVTILMGAIKIQTPFFGLSPIWWTVLAASGIVLGAAYMLWLYQRTMFGKLDNPENQKLTDMNSRELAYLLPLVILAFWIGLYPTPFFRAMEKPIDKLVRQVEGTYYTEAVASAEPGDGSQDAAGGQP